MHEGWRHSRDWVGGGQLPSSNARGGIGGTENNRAPRRRASAHKMRQCWNHKRQGGATKQGRWRGQPPPKEWQAR